MWDIVDSGSEGKEGGGGSKRGEAVLLKKDYFQWRYASRVGGERGRVGGERERVKVDLMNDYFLPFAVHIRKSTLYIHFYKSKCTEGTDFLPFAVQIRKKQCS